ncbi:divalent metal cation transporter [Caballeronia sp. GAWG1-1]|uniref:NRAMP family divalent metal transporter n=1 Tax=Caballeronia sp. GAWG1-1 TaxID=2921742 RepID=UPI0020283C29|nr:divalent metal cation transporter [Caballeronia sp. GAWG1-1]
MLADTDVGNVVSAAQSGARWGYRLLPLLLGLIPALYVVQELALRLGMFTGLGHGELIRDAFGKRWSRFATVGMSVSAIGSVIAQLAGVAGVGEMYGIPREVSVPLAAVSIAGIVLSGSHRRVERAALAIGLVELTFFFVAWKSHPNMGIIARHTLDQPVSDRDYLYFAAALVGASINPWMIFYQQSAMARQRVRFSDYSLARASTLCGAALTQLLTAAVMVTVAAKVGDAKTIIGFKSIQQLCDVMAYPIGNSVERSVISAGLVGSALVAALVASLSMVWGMREAAQADSPAGWWVSPVYGVAILGGVGVVIWAPDPIGLNIILQVLNACLLPLALGLLVALAVRALPRCRQLRGTYLWCVICVACGLSVLGLFGGFSGLL